MSDAHSMMLFCLCSDCFMPGNVSSYAFSGWFKRIKPDNGEIEFDENLLLADETFEFIE